MDVVSPPLRLLVKFDFAAGLPFAFTVSFVFLAEEALALLNSPFATLVLSFSSARDAFFVSSLIFVKTKHYMLEKVH